MLIRKHVSLLRKCSLLSDNLGGDDDNVVPEPELDALADYQDRSPVLSGIKEEKKMRIELN